MKWILIAVIGLSMTSMAQTVKVIQLDPSDASKMAILQNRRALLDKEISQLTETIREKYLKAPKASHYYGIKSGCGLGDFSFSDDFKYIVPLLLPHSIVTPSYGVGGLCNIKPVSYLYENN